MRIQRSVWVLTLGLVYLQGVAGEQATTPKDVPLQSVLDAVWDASRGQLLVSTGTSIAVVNPTTASVEETFASCTGNRIAVTDDGQYLYCASTSGTVRRYNLANRALDITFNVPAVQAIAAIPGQPQSVLISRAAAIEVYDNAVRRPGSLSTGASSLWVRPSDGVPFGFSEGYVYEFRLGASGISLLRTFTVPRAFSYDSRPLWRGSILMDRAGYVFDLSQGNMSGRVPVGKGCALLPDSSGAAVLAAEGDTNPYSPAAYLVRYPLDSLRASGNIRVTTGSEFAQTACNSGALTVPLGNEGIAIGRTPNRGGSNLMVLRFSDFDPISAAAPEPKVDSAGIISLPIAAGGLAYDSTRGLLWVSASGETGQIGNNVVGIDPGNGRIVESIFAGSDPGPIVLSSDSTRLFTILRGAYSIAAIDLEAKQIHRRFSVLGDQGYTPSSIAAIPNRRDRVAVVRIPVSPSYASEVSIFDNGVRLPKSVANFKPGAIVTEPNRMLVTHLSPGDSPNSLYGANHHLQYGDGTHEVARLAVDEEGISLDAVLKPLQLGMLGAFGVQLGVLHYDSGFLFTGGGELRTPDTRVLHGTFSLDQSYGSWGVPIPFLDRNQVAFLHQSNLTRSRAITLFDVSTFRPVATVDFPADAGAVIGAVAAGAHSIGVITSTKVLFVPLAAMRPWRSYSPVLQSVSPGIQRVELPVNAMAAVRGDSKLILAMAATAGEFGNSLVYYDPFAGRFERSVYVGSDPTLLSMAPDGSAANVRLSGEQRIARVNIASATRDLVFAPDPAGGSKQYPIVDVETAADGGVALSYYGGGIAVFDNGVPRPIVDANTEGTAAFLSGTWDLAFNDTGTILYARETTWSNGAFKRCTVSPEGVKWASSADGLFGGAYKTAQGLLYTSSGGVFDAERTRFVGQFVTSSYSGSIMVEPDPASGRLFLLSRTGLHMFDLASRALLGSLVIERNYDELPVNLVRFGEDGIAFHTRNTSTEKAHVYITRVSAIPLLPEPVPSPQPSLPSTPGVTVVDLAARDMAYDRARDLIYITTPNREAANGDRIAAIDPASGSVVRMWPAGSNPGLLTIAEDQSRLFYTVGGLSNQVLSGYSLTSDVLRTFDLATAEIGPAFPARPPASDTSYRIAAIAALPGQPGSVAAIDFLGQFSGGTSFGLGVDALRVYDEGTARQVSLGPRTISCGQLTAGASASRLYCSSGATLVRMTVDEKGVSLLDSFNLLPGRGTFGPMAFSGGRLYTSTGLVIEPEAKRIVTRMDTYGAVAVEGNTVYWVDPSAWTAESPNVSLRSFDTNTLRQIGSRTVKVTSSEVTRLIPAGQGRMAFRAGNEIYIVHP